MMSKSYCFWILVAGLMLAIPACKKQAQDPQPPAEQSATETAPTASPEQAQNDAHAGHDHVHHDHTHHDHDHAHPHDHAHDHNHGPMNPPQLNIPAPADVAAPPEDAVKTASGLAYKYLRNNPDGKAIASDDLVELHYTGWTTDGKAFDSSTVRGQAAVFTPEALIPGMKEALLLAKTGEQLRVWIPENLAYQGQFGAPQGMLVFDFNILRTLTPEAPPMEIPSDAKMLPNGIAYRLLTSIEGAPKLSENDIVTLEFSAWQQRDGKRFHSSHELGSPLVIPINKLIPGWKSVLLEAHKGARIQSWVPQALGLDPEGRNGLEGVLIFDMTVIDVKTMPKAPEDVAAPPKDAEVTASGLASKVLQAGTGKQPTDSSQVSVHYTGWTTDGEVFDSSLASGEPVTFPLSGVIEGWREGVKLMKVGEKRRLWIPENLAYKGAEGAPKGMLVFDIELLNVL